MRSRGFGAINSQLAPALARVSLSPFMRNIVGKNPAARPPLVPGIMLTAPIPPSQPVPAAQQTVHLDVKNFAAGFRETMTVNNQCVGYSAQLNVGGQLLWQDYYGWAQTPAGQSTGIPWSSSVRQNVASVSKLLTAMCMARMCQQYNLDPTTTKMSQFLPGYWQKGSNVNQITLAQLLTHTSGIPDSNADIATMKAQIAAGVWGLPAPRAYSNSNFGLMRFIIAHVMGGVTDQAVAAVNPGSKPSDSFWDYLAISAYEYCMQQYVFAPSGVSGASTVHAPGDALAYAAPSPSPTVSLFQSGWNDGDMGAGVGASGWHLTPSDVLKCMSTFRRTSAIVTPNWSESFIANGYGLDVITQIEPIGQGQAETASPPTAGDWTAYLYAKNGGNYYGGASGPLQGEQSVACFLPDNMELVALCNSVIMPAPDSNEAAPSGNTGLFFMGMVTSVYQDQMKPCPAGTYWNGNACIKQVVFQQPAAPTPSPATPGAQPRTVLR